MKGRRFVGDTTVGHVVLALDSSDPNAAGHWAYITQTNSTELTKWHVIQRHQDRL